MAKKRKASRRKPRTTVLAHSAVRRSCIHCKHSHKKNVDRFHKIGSFCKTHRTTKIGRKYCGKIRKTS